MYRKYKAKVENVPPTLIRTARARSRYKRSSATVRVPSPVPELDTPRNNAPELDTPRKVSPELQVAQSNVRELDTSQVILSESDTSQATVPGLDASRTIVPSRLDVPTWTLNSGYTMPVMGFGTWKSHPGEIGTAVAAALEAGYRHFDCAYIHMNEAEVGLALREALDQGKVKREELFITSKLWHTRHYPDDVKPSLQESLTSFGLEYLDLYLIQHPQAFKRGKELLPVDENGEWHYVDSDHLETWKALEACVDDGLVRSIGVSNFNSQQIDNIVSNGRIKPALIQTEIHPYFVNDKLVQHCLKREICVTGYSAFGAPDNLWAKEEKPLVLEEPKLKEIAKKYDKLPAQLVLRWLYQRNIATIPKSMSSDRITSNIKIFDFELTADDMETMNSFDRNVKLIGLFVERNGQLVFSGLDKPNSPYTIEY